MRTLLRERTTSPRTLTPIPMAGLSMWLDAGTLGLSNGATVTTWADRTGAHSFTTQGSPTYNSAGSFPYVHFVSASAQAMIASTAVSPLYPNTIVWVMALNTQSGGNSGVISTSGSGNSDFGSANGYTIFSAGTTVLDQISNGVTLGNMTVQYDGSFGVFSARSSTTNWEMARKGNASLRKPVTATAGTPTRTVIAARVGSAVATPYTGMDLAVLFYYNRILTDTEMFNLTEALKIQYGL